MGTVLGIGIPLFIVAVFGLLIWLLARSGLKKKKRNLALMAYARDRGYEWVGDDLRGRVEGVENGRRFSLEFAIVHCSADPSAGPGAAVPRMQKLETVVRMAVPAADGRALVGKPFFRNAIHDPLRGGLPVELGEPAFDQTYQVLAPPDQDLGWLDAGVRQSLLSLGARELRLDQGELSLNLDRMDPDPARLDAAVQLMSGLADRIG